MVVCRYFQQGYCRYGQNCRFEHVYGSKYNYHAGAPAQNALTPSGVSDEALINQVQTDVQSALKGGQWILSSFAPFKDKPALPGLSDLSPEEARLFVYEAKENNNLEQAVTYLNNLTKEYRFKYEQLLQPGQQIIKSLRSLYTGEVVSDPFTNSQNVPTFGNSSTNNASSIFRSAVQNTSVFNQNTANTNSNSVFGQKVNSNVFGTQNSDNSNAKSIFAQATQSAFGSNQPVNNFFTNQSPQNNAAKSIFAQANQNVFGSTPAAQKDPANIFATASQKIFSSPAETFGSQSNSPFSQTSGNIFQRETPATNVFGTATTNTSNESTDSGVYSNIGDLTQDDLEAFKSDDFQLGFIPEIPPPKSLCF